MTPLDEKRLALSKETTDEVKSGLGQYMTPCATADFLASLLDPYKFDHCDLLDPGAGIGTLSIAFLMKLGEWSSRQKEFLLKEVDERKGAMK